MSLLTAVRNDMCYCPGCSHGLVLEQLAQAIARLALPPPRVCLVSDIGCIGTADRYFTCHTFHGLHGRSFTYAEGIQRVRPDVLTIVLVGDGGCGIGTAHLVHAARRGVPIKVIVCNNFNFGMTGGQHSPTTPADALTPTTPAGFHERPFDIAETARISGASFVARASAYDAGLPGLLERGLRAPGFALLEVWELCSAYFVQSNKLTPARLNELAARGGMPFGVLAEPPAGDARPAAPSSPADTGKAASDETVPQPRGPKLPWPGRREITLAGSAGQHIRTAVGALGEIAVACGLHAAEHDDYPITVRKGHSISNLVVDARPILFAGVEAPALVIIMSADGAARVGDLSHLPSSSQVIVASDLPPPATPATVHVVDLDAFARAATRAGVALALLAYGVVRAGWVESEALCAAADAVLSGRHRESNLSALRAGVAAAAAQSPACAASTAGGRHDP
ncbi:MAG: hypothetical protein CHACPFDD_00524 [Phycisphaerae bacterium]|nr:hypothetical protein [Phycisphaerae bacterium]